MNQCEMFEERLNEALDLRQSPCDNPGLREHANQCVECRQLFGAYLQMLDGVAKLEIDAPAPGFAERIVARVEAARSTRRRRVRALGSLAAAAALLVAAFLGFRSLGPDRGPDSSPSQIAERSPSALQSSPDSPGKLTAPQDAIAPLIALPEVATRNTAGGRSVEGDPQSDFSDQDLLFSGILARGTSPDNSRSAADWVAAMNRGLKPLSDSTSGALYQLTDAFPFDDDSGF